MPWPTSSWAPGVVLLDVGQEKSGPPGPEAQEAPGAGCARGCALCPLPEFSQDQAGWTGWRGRGEEEVVRKEG